MIHSGSSDYIDIQYIKEGRNERVAKLEKSGTKPKRVHSHKNLPSSNPGNQSSKNNIKINSFFKEIE